jgi:hypothetical protein
MFTRHRLSPTNKLDCPHAMEANADRMQAMTEEKDLLCKRAGCNHPRSLHTKDIRDTGTRAETALLRSEGGNIFSGTAESRSGCTVLGCSCRVYIQ